MRAAKVPVKLTKASPCLWPSVLCPDAEREGAAKPLQTYAQMTLEDPNPLKRWVQRRRLADALACVTAKFPVDNLVDYGAGDGALALMAARRWPNAGITCFEPASPLADEAERRLADVPRARVVREETALPPGVDLVFCTEVFEHLPEAETEAAIRTIDRILRPTGLLVVGVPVEVGPVAGLKGLFRMTRRPGDFDARPEHVWNATVGRPPKNRPTAEFVPGRAYHSHHLGFDHRRLRRRLETAFGPVRMRGSPFAFAPVMLNSEAYMTLRKEPS